MQCDVVSKCCTTSVPSGVSEAASEAVSEAASSL